MTMAKKTTATRYAAPSRQQTGAAAASEPGKPPTAPQSVVVDLGLPGLVEYESLGYLPSRPEVILSPYAREAVKRLSLTLDMQGAKLADGTLVQGHCAKTINWLCERLADSIAESRARGPRDRNQ